MDAAATNCAGADGSAARPFCTIGEAIARAGAGDTVWIAGGNYPEAPLSIDFDVDLVGVDGSAATVIDARRLHRPLHVSGGASVRMVGITVRSGLQVPGGVAAGIWVDGATLELEGCELTDCVDGATIAAEDASLSLRQTTLRNDEFGILCFDSDLALEECTVVGLANAVWSERGAVTCIDSVFTSNTSDGSGGAINVEQPRGSYVFRDCEFSRNSARSPGGAIAIGNAISSSFDAVFERCSFLDGSALSGGAVQIRGDTATSAAFVDCRFERNRASSVADPYGHPGGAVELALGEATELSFDRCTFVANQAPTGTGGALSAGGGGSGSLRIADCTFDGNRGELGGGISVSWQGAATIDRCAFRGNTASGLAKRKGALYGSGGVGGGAQFFGASVVVRDSEFVDNVSLVPSSGPNVAAQGAGLYLGNSESLLERVRIARNRIVAGFRVDSFGGGCSLDSRTASLRDCEFVGNEIAEAEESGFGAGLYCGGYRADVTLERCTIAGNVASGGYFHCGGLAIDDWSSDAADVSLSGVVIAGNSSADGIRHDFVGGYPTLGWNLVGDTAGGSLIGDPSNDLLDVDPLFADPGRGDWTLRVDSPAVDSGDPATASLGAGIAGMPRLLDGDLDRALRVDRGAHEFSHVRASVSGAAQLGGSLALALRGTPNDLTWLFLGTAAGISEIPHFGALLLDVAAPLQSMTWANVPSDVVVDVPFDPAIVGVYFVQVASFLGDAGNLSNVVRVEID
ncbi:MAG: right-handed parallel beta-helix repeat-containing protein [Planctomycetes bacterium]|nr:right-handed parallel beta-helix repeat-containing protein [Planctomycetota bacterium]